MARLRAWLDKPNEMGLQPAVQNLVVLAFAAQADRTLVRNGAPAPASIERLEDEVELREQPLPDEDILDSWRGSAPRPCSVCCPSEVRKGATVAKLAAELKAAAAEKRPVLAALSQALTPRCDAFGVPTAAPRLMTLRSAQTLLTDIAGASDALATILVLAGAELGTSQAAVSKCLGSAAEVRDAVNAALWDVISTAAGLTDQRRAAAEGLRARVAEALGADEHAARSPASAAGRQGRAGRLLAEMVAPPPRPPSRHLRRRRTAPATSAASARRGSGGRAPECFRSAPTMRPDSGGASGSPDGNARCPADDRMAPDTAERRRACLSALLAPDLAQIERELDKLLHERPGRASARHALARPSVWPDHIERGGRRFRLSWCTSELEVRERLDEVEAEDDEGVVVLTPLDAVRWVAT